ncbi:MAG: flavodoxin family protein [Alphaproteobacteria bacterium]|nr:flavodoxin family protein [Alphaproteobacteria bacterium]MBQ9235156.1 flavodoxin family protein [Alphaproteobacteria bacterium]
MTKVMILNASPRKNCNTAKMLKEAARGATETGAEVEYIDLVSLNYKGCMSCFACKVKGNKTGGLCAFKDDLRPVLEKILQADALIVGTPIYYSYPTGMFRNLMERLLFAVMTYSKGDKPNMPRLLLEKKLATGLIYTMNCTPERAEQFNYPAILAPDNNYMELYFGHCEVLNAFNTYQFNDYSKYMADIVDVAEKEHQKETQFPKDLQAAYEMGKRLATMKL